MAIEPSRTAIISPRAVVTTAQVRMGSDRPSCSVVCGAIGWSWVRSHHDCGPMHIPARLRLRPMVGQPRRQRSVIPPRRAAPCRTAPCRAPGRPPLRSPCRKRRTRTQCKISRTRHIGQSLGRHRSTCSAATRPALGNSVQLADVVRSVGVLAVQRPVQARNVGRAMAQDVAVNRLRAARRPRSMCAGGVRSSGRRRARHRRAA